MRWPRSLYRAARVSLAAVLNISTVEMARSDQSLRTRVVALREAFAVVAESRELRADCCFISPPPCRFWRLITYLDREVNNTDTLGSVLNTVLPILCCRGCPVSGSRVAKPGVGFPPLLEEEFPMTMQVGMVGTDGVLIASDTRWMNTPRLRNNQFWAGGRYTFNSPKIRISHER